MKTTYSEFLEAKKKTVAKSGIDISTKYDCLFPFQQYCVAKALKNGRFALFEDCGLGKTRQQIVWANEVVKHTGKSVIILAPLAVTAQTIQEGEKIGIPVIEYLEVIPMNLPVGIYITNYEQMEHLVPDDYSGVVLDESSILKNFEGALRNSIITYFDKTPYKLACTATPSPNDPMELGNHSEFLNVMGRNEMLSMYFVHDGGETAKWRLKGHCEQLFWDWVGSWSVMVTTPADIGYKMDGYNLPPLNFIELSIATPKKDNGLLFNDVAVSATNYNEELRNTMAQRLEAVANIVNASTEQFIVWVKQNEEGEQLRKMIPDAIEVKGSDHTEYKKEKLLGFADNKFRVLITKTKIAQFGLNYQCCHNQVFASLDFSFEGTYQAIRRSYRFGQTHEVNIYLVITDTMQNVATTIKQKELNFEAMKAGMQAAMNRNHKHTKNSNRMPDFKNNNVLLQHGDCVELIKGIPSNSVGMSIFSPPFAELYTYSDELADMGNSANYREFLTAFKFLVSELYRVIMDGRNVVVHCMDLPIQKGKEGYIGLRDFSGMIRRTFEAEGFIYHSRVTIWKNPVTEMQRTKALGLLHKQIKKDAAYSRVGIPDYLLVFRKPGDAISPVIHQDNDPAKENYLPVDLWQKYASPVWMDIDYGNTLNVRSARDEKDEKHICPLQLDTIERALHLWSNEGDTILTPFAGIGSEPYSAIKLNRKAIGFELKSSYFRDAVKNVKRIIETKATSKELF